MYIIVQEHMLLYLYNKISYTQKFQGSKVKLHIDGFTAGYNIILNFKFEVYVIIHMYNIHTHTHTECFTKLVPKSGICFTKHCIHHSRKFKRERKFKIYKNLQTKAFSN